MANKPAHTPLDIHGGFDDMVLDTVLRSLLEVSNSLANGLNLNSMKLCLLRFHGFTFLNCKAFDEWPTRRWHWTRSTISAEISEMSS